MLQGEHSAILSTFIKLPFVIKIFALSIFLGDRFTQILLYPVLKTVDLDQLASKKRVDQNPQFSTLQKAKSYQINPHCAEQHISGLKTVGVDQLIRIHTVFHSACKYIYFC